MIYSETQITPECVDMFESDFEVRSFFDDVILNASVFMAFSGVMFLR